MKVSYTKNLRNSTDLRIHSIISILTEAYDYVKLTEAVPYSVAKEYLQIERSPEAESRVKSIFGKLKSLPNAKQLDKRGYRIAFPYAEDSTEFEIQSILEPYNFSIKNYKDGLALDTKSNKEIAIGKALNKISKKEPDAKELIDRYAAIKGKGATNKDEDLMVVFSSAKYDITGMSTGREWRSCMNVIDGENMRYVKTDIIEGSIICYLTTIGDTNLKKPLGRILIKPYLNLENPKDVILYAEYKTYGTKLPNSEKFIDIVDEYMEKTQKLSGSYERLGCLYPDSERDEIESKETIQKRALEKIEKKEKLTDAEFVSLPLKNKRKLIDEYIDNSDIINTIRISFASESQKKKYVRLLLKYNESDSIEEPLFLKLSKELKYEIIDYKIKKFAKLEAYEFRAANEELKDRYNDSRIAKGLYIPKRHLGNKVENYIDARLEFGHELDAEELRIATEKQREIYLDEVIYEGRRYLSNLELNFTSEKQFIKYISKLYKKNDSFSLVQLNILSDKNMEILIDYLLENDLSKMNVVDMELTDKQVNEYLTKLIKNNYEIEIPSIKVFSQATKKVIEKYIDFRFNKKYRIPFFLRQYMNEKQKEKFINYSERDEPNWALIEDLVIKDMIDRHKAIDAFLDQKYVMSKEVLEFATPEQKERFKEYAKD
jgi:hypothetical protein